MRKKHPNSNLIGIAQLNRHTFSLPQIKVWESDQDFTTANDTFVYIGSPLEAYISDLAPGKSYMLRVLAFSRGGDGKKSSPPWKFQMGEYSSLH